MMINFLLKKSFFDAWDNLLRIILLNLLAITVLGGISLLIRIEILPIEITFYILFTALILILHIFAGTVSAALGEVADFTSFRFKALPEVLKRIWPGCLSIGFISIILIFINTKVLSIAFSSSDLIGYIPAGIVFWINILWLSILQYLFPLLARSESPFLRILLKSFIIVLDNPGATAFALLFSVILGVLSIFTLFIIPGFAGILLFHQNLLRLLLRKYAWLETEPQRNRKKVSWDMLIKEDSDILGNRTLKGLLFPWRD